MKILMLTSRFGFGYGMGYAAYSEAIALTALGHYVTVIHCNRSSDIAQYNNPQITFFHLPIKRIPLVNFLIFSFKLRRLLKKSINFAEFDAIYIQSLEFGLADLAKIKLPIFYFARSTIIGPQKILLKEVGRASLLTRIVRYVLISLERRCMRYSKIIFVKSREMVREVSSLYHVNQDKIAIITGGINKSDFQTLDESLCVEFKNKLGIPLNEYVVLYAGRIVPQKGLIYLIEASLNLLRECNFVVVIAGADLNELYAAKVKRLLDNNIYQKAFYFLGHVDQLSMSLVLNSADCLVTPSLYEPFGMVNLQAAFLGKNIITTDVTGSVDLLANYKNIKIIKAGSTTAVELALREVIYTKKQKNYSMTDFSRYSWSYVAGQLLRYFSATTVN